MNPLPRVQLSEDGAGIFATMLQCLSRPHFFQNGPIPLFSAAQIRCLRMHTSHDQTTFTLAGKAWSGTYPLHELPKWLAFYRHQKERFPKSGSAYDSAITVLEELAAKLGIET
ncbi:hypothetical protein [Paracoccus cavernae]